MYRIALATAADIAPITALLQANAPEQGGSLTGSFADSQVRSMIESGMPVIVAYRVSHLAGVMISTPMEAPSQPPVITAMRKAWPGRPDAYIYGPVCIATSERRRGLLPILYASLVEQLPGREAVLFIRHDNIGSLRAHRSLGMHEVAEFTLDSVKYVVFSNMAG